MCGIAGFLTKNFPDLSTQHLLDMGNAIAHRGPDAHGEYLDSHVGLSHRRLSILDLSEAGNQPMFSHDNKLVIVFNGEIYNFLDIKEELKSEGVEFRTGTDTEVILHLYAKYGTDCLEKLNGMFAFALWDVEKSELFIARDRLGKKPLYYLEHNGRFAFASEIKAILTLPDVPREIRLDAVYDFFAYQYVPDPKSIFTHIHKLPPAHYMLIKDGDILIEEYWRLSFANVAEKSESELKNDLKHIANACTRRRMISDVPLGAFLSGGVDSSGVVAMMTQHSEKPVKTCTIAFDDKKFNESEFARSVAEQYGTEHHEFTVHQNVKETINHIVSFFDEPFADPSLVPTYFVSELARKEVTVAIAGDGGDEVFAGYQKYNTDNIENNLRKKFPRWLRTAVFPSLSLFFSKINTNVCKKASSLLSSLSVEPAKGFYITNSQITESEWRLLSNDKTKIGLKGYHPSEITTNFYNASDGNDHLARILYTDIKTYLTGGILVKVDRMSMANSLEVRAPILDKEMLEFAATVPSRLKFNGGEKKYLLKEAFKDYLNDDILYRKKMGFSVPLDSWFRTELKDLAYDNLIKSPDGLRQFFNIGVIKSLWEQHQQDVKNHGNLLWSLLMFELWWKRYASPQP